MSAAERAVHNMRIASRILAEDGNRTMAAILNESADELAAELREGDK